LKVETEVDFDAPEALAELVARAKSEGKICTQICKEYFTAIHQMHNYKHANAHRRNIYMTGKEAKENQRLGGGRHLVLGSVGTHRLTPNGIEPEKALLLNPHFWADVPRFLRLLKNLVLSR